MDEVRTCIGCGATKPADEFDRRADTGRRVAKCKDCRRAYQRGRLVPAPRRAEPPDGMRWCSRCGQDKPLAAFPPVRRGQPQLQRWCRDCFAGWNAAYYRRNHQAQKARLLRNMSARRADNRRRMVDYLLRHACVDCGEDDIVVLEFDHLRDKVDDVTTMVAAGRSWRHIEQEIAKCEVRCAKCHRLKTLAALLPARDTETATREPPAAGDTPTSEHDDVRVCSYCREPKPPEAFAWKVRRLGQRQSWCRLCKAAYHRAWWARMRESQMPRIRRNNTLAMRKKRAWITRYLESHQCVDCGERDPRLLDFDHQSDKRMNVASTTGRSWSFILAEIAKCEVRCVNCHRRRTARAIGAYRLLAATATRAGIEPAALTFVV